jgi:hypothetical protein
MWAGTDEGEGLCRPGPSPKFETKKLASEKKRKKKKRKEKKTLI